MPFALELEGGLDASKNCVRARPELQERGRRREEEQSAAFVDARCAGELHRGCRVGGRAAGGALAALAALSAAS